MVGLNPGTVGACFEKISRLLVIANEPSATRRARSASTVIPRMADHNVSLLPTPVAPVEDVNPTGFNLGSDFGLYTSGPPPPTPYPQLGVNLFPGDTVQMVSQLPGGQIEDSFFDAQTRGLTGSLLESYTPPPGWLVTDGGAVATEILPLSAPADYPGFFFL